MAFTKNNEKLPSTPKVGVEGDEESNLLEVLPPPTSKEKESKNDQSVLTTTEYLSPFPHCLVHPFWLLVFVTASLVNAWISSAYLLHELLKYFSDYQYPATSTNWKCPVIALMDMLTFIRIVFQVMSAMNFLCGSYNSTMEQEYDCAVRYNKGTVYVAMEQIFSVVCVFARILLENLPEDEVLWKMAFMTANIMDLLFFVWGSMFFYCYAETMRFELEGYTTRIEV